MYQKLNSILSKDIAGIICLILLGIIGYAGYRLHVISVQKGDIRIDSVNLDTVPALQTNQAAVINAVIPTQVQKPLVISSSTSGSGSNLPIPKGQVVASKSGKVYHLPTCSGAKRILPQNQRWFATIADAKAAGLKPASNCKGLK